MNNALDFQAMPFGGVGPNLFVGQAAPALAILPKSVGLLQVIKECIDSKKFANLRPVYVSELERYLGKFRELIGDMPINSVTVEHLQLLLSKPEWACGTRATGINRLSALFSFAKRRGYVIANPVDRIDRIRLERKPPQILSPAEAEQLLTAARRRTPSLLANLVIGMFAGVRPTELEKLQWADVDLDRAIIRVDAAASKVRRRRIVELEPNAVAFLLLCVSKIGAVTPAQKRRKMRRLIGEMGWETWPKDILRHSCASYALAKYRDAGLVADKLGNSPGILLRHYRELVSKEDCEKFWAIVPI